MSRLPHFYPRDRWLFLTGHSHGSLPASRYPPPHKASAGQAFVWIDRQLDEARSGPMVLRQDAVATVVVESLFPAVALGHYELAVWVVMANHVHVLLLPKVAPSRLLKSLKGATAREANRLLGTTGDPFGSGKPTPTQVRDGAEWNRIAAYIENNPVRAGLCARPDEFPWSSANPRWPRAGAAGVGTSACATDPR